MSAQVAQSGPVPTTNASSPSPQQLQTAFDNGIWYILSLWPALQVACQNHWGGPNCDDKRDWFAGAISDLFADRPNTDFEDLVEVLLQVMQDEFDTRVEDDSEEEVARSILVLKKRLVEEQSLAAFQEVEQRWKNRGKMKTDVKVVDGEVEVGEDEDDWEGFDDEDEDTEMGGVALNATPIAKKEKLEPEIDEEGFTKVVRKR